MTEDETMTAPRERDEYTPTTAHVIEAIMNEHVQVADNPDVAALCSCGVAGMVPALAYAGRWHRAHVAAQVDRWLAQHDAEVREAVARDLTAIAEASRTGAEATTGLERAVLNGNARCFDAAAAVARGVR